MKTSATDYGEIYLNNKHTIAVTESDPSQNKLIIDYASKVTVDDFSDTDQTDIVKIAENAGMDSPLKELNGWTAWYGAVYSRVDNGVLINYLEPTKAKKYGTADFTVNDQLTIEYIKSAYEAYATNYDFFNNTAFVVQLKSE